MLNGLLSIAKNGSFHKSNKKVCFWWKYEKLVACSFNVSVSLTLLSLEWSEPTHNEDR